MACDALLWGLIVFGCSIQLLLAVSEDDPLEYMSKEEREALKEEARDMFYHAYNAYMDNAYPADELMPLSCKGRYRGSEPNRGDIDSTLGNFSLTLVDTLDTLVVLGDFEEFENAVKLVARDVTFDTDVIVSLFETNIRMLGGLLSGHILAEYLQQRANIMPWYRGELLNLAKDLGYRFLPAFNTTTGIPYGRINLKYGMKGVPLEVSRETCTACAGSMILEMAALSRLTGESIFEEKAQKAMDVLWRMRHRGTDLMGSVLNVHSGDWVRRDSGVGAGIDSYYEYCLKAYILLGDEKYLGRFNKHYQAVMKYVSQGPMLLDVHMHRPNTNSKNFMDALLAFWPGLQVLKGDIKPAVETHEMLYQVMQRHNFIPEAFTTDFQVHWGHHPLRPEFLESTYFLYRATGDHYYLGVGRKVLKSLQTYARVPCGYAAVSDVRTNKHDDTMDSFVLSETFKYLFLLFAEPGELVLDLDEFIFTTEGHLLPLTLASIRTNISSELERDIVHVDEMDRTCPNSLHLFPASVRQPLRNMVEDVCPRRNIKRRLSAAQFQANNIEHLKILGDMGITALTLADGRVQLLHMFSNAKTLQDSEEGLLFMQEMVEISKMQSQQAETKPQAVSFVEPFTFPSRTVKLLAGPADFGLELQGANKVTGKVVFTKPLTGCTELSNADELAGKIAMMNRGNCMFIEKARRIQKAGAIAGIVLDNVHGSSATTSPMFAMSGDGKDDDVTIPVVFLFRVEAVELIKAITAEPNGELTVTLGSFFSKEEVQLKAPTDLSMFERVKGSLKSLLNRQVTPQTSATSGTNLDIIVPEIKNQDSNKVVVDFDHLHAEIISRGGISKEIRITATQPSTSFKKLEDTSVVELRWRLIKEAFVNQIYQSKKDQSSLNIESDTISYYYDLMMIARRLAGNIPNVSLPDKLLWFLKELSETSPDPFNEQIYPDIMEHVSELGFMPLNIVNLDTKFKMDFLQPVQSIKQLRQNLEFTGKSKKDKDQDSVAENAQKKSKGDDATIAEFTTDASENNKGDVKAKDAWQTPSKSDLLKTEKFEDFVNILLSKMEKTVKSTEQNNLRKYQDIVGISKENEETGDPSKVQEASLQNQTKDEKRKRRVKYKLEMMENTIDDFIKVIESLIDVPSDSVSPLEQTLKTNDEGTADKAQDAKETSKEPSETNIELKLSKARVVINPPNTKSVEDTKQEIISENKADNADTHHKKIDAHVEQSSEPSTGGNQDLLAEQLENIIDLLWNINEHEKKHEKKHIDDEL